MKKSLQAFFVILIAGAIGIAGAIWGAKFPEYSTYYLYGLILVGVAIVCTFIGYSSSNSKEKKKVNKKSDSNPTKPQKQNDSVFEDVYSHS